MNKFARFLNLFLRPVQWLIFFVSGFSPRKENWYVFGENNGTFKESTRYLAIELAKYPSNTRVFWVCRDEKIKDDIQSFNIEPVKFGSLKYFMITLLCSKYFYSHYVTDISFWLSRKAEKYNLWHGHPLKKIEHDFINSKIYNVKSHWYLFYKFYSPWRTVKDFSLMVNYSSFEPILSKAFNIRKKSLLKCRPIKHEVINNLSGYLLQDEMMFIDKYRASSKIKILYLPTFRCKKLESGLIERLTMIFREVTKNPYIELYYKLHPNTQLDSYNNESSNIIKIPSNVDPLFLFSESDVLISDYSSLIVDYILMSSGLLCIDDYDIEEYKANDRSFYFPWESIKKTESISIDEVLNNNTSIIKNCMKNKASEGELFFGTTYKVSLLKLVKDAQCIR